METKEKRARKEKRNETNQMSLVVFVAQVIGSLLVPKFEPNWYLFLRLCGLNFDSWGLVGAVCLFDYNMFPARASAFGILSNRVNL